jgi:hypothetical protein
MTAVRLHLSSGERRLIEHADGARLDGAFFIVTRWCPDLKRRETVLTLRPQDVVFAEILRDGVQAECVAGAGST